MRWMSAAAAHMQRRKLTATRKTVSAVGCMCTQEDLEGQLLLLHRLCVMQEEEHMTHMFLLCSCSMPVCRGVAGGWLRDGGWSWETIGQCCSNEGPLTSSPPMGRGSPSCDNFGCVGDSKIR